MYRIASAEEVYADLEKSARKELEKTFSEDMRKFKDYENVLLRGTPYEEITKFAEANMIDLIVIATHGRTGLDRLLFGSTAEQVVRYAPARCSRCACHNIRMHESLSF